MEANSFELAAVESPDSLVEAIQWCDLTQQGLLSALEAHITNPDNKRLEVDSNDARITANKALESTLQFIITDSETGASERAFYCAALLHRIDSSRTKWLNDAFPDIYLTEAPQTLDETSASIKALLQEEGWVLSDLLYKIIDDHYLDALETSLADLMHAMEDPIPELSGPNLTVESTPAAISLPSPVQIGRHLLEFALRRTELAIGTIVVGRRIFRKVTKI